MAVEGIRRNVPLAPLTWFGIGGGADRFVSPASPDRLAELIHWSNSESLTVRVLGKGANLLVADEGVDGLVVRLDAPLFRAVEIREGTGTVRAAAGADLEKLITTTVRQGLGGLEALGGIPATVGGALKMNAGGAFGEIGPHVRSVTLLEPDGALHTLPGDQAGFAYRHSNLGHGIIVEAEFALTPADPDRLRDRLKEVMAYKKKSQPMAASSAGCCFKNPPRHVSEKGAGKLIDEAGLKRLRIGGAEVSPLHANFIVLHPGATAADVLALMNDVQLRVADRFGIQLEREVVVWSRESG